ncbi:hypothetical protein STCU_00827 [Strigomonas culicis]|uniref:Uncharacterized protein n=1 Tax=Strigomonas culicis TaxID=28005 RepID=S9W9J6_9TRYP|nr:hypothetical protein STCU_00827 [Strigomonas culicis]|eukprot:EPY35956.1 hypothetical protein STCU_00827 [Strigomonas culicis]
MIGSDALSVEHAVKSVTPFLGCPVADYPFSREPMDTSSVPQDDEGLRLLAANGEWTAVLSLADKLEDQVASCNASEVAHLPYVLVRITAYFKLQRIGDAASLVRLLGDVEGGKAYVDAATKENMAPFSLRYIVALMPYYLNESSKAIGNMCALLHKCDTGRTAATTPSQQHVWTSRWRRVLRAMIALYFAEGQLDTCIRLFDRLIHSYDVDVASQEAGAATARVVQVMYLQQYACFCLQCGRAALAKDLFRQLEAQTAPAAGGRPSLLHTAHVEMDRAFVHIFDGEFPAAAALLERQAVYLKEAVRAAPDGDSAEALVLQRLWTQAQMAHLTALPYTAEAGGAHDPLTMMDTIIGTMERYVRENAAALLQLDSFVEEAVRLYTLAGDPEPHMARLANLLEVFRCERSCIPKLEEMV